MYKCAMKEVVHESVYDVCEKLLDDMCYSNNNCHDDENTLKLDLYNLISDRIDVMTTYDMNAILLSYGIDEAVREYYDSEYMDMDDIFDNFSKTIITFLIKSSFDIDEDE
jgi:hypothetical protein